MHPCRTMATTMTSASSVMMISLHRKFQARTLNFQFSGLEESRARKDVLESPAQLPWCIEHIRETWLVIRMKTLASELNLAPL